MNRDKALDQIKHISTTHLLTEQEIVTAYREGQSEVTVSGRPLNFSEITSFIGAIIVVTGIAVLMAGSWDSLTDVAKIFATLGIGSIFYVLGIFLEGKEKAHILATAVQFIAAAILPLGLLVSLEIGGFEMNSSYFQLIPALLLTMVYSATWFTYRKPLYLFFAIAYGTWAYLVLGATVLQNLSFEAALPYFLYIPVTAGLTYMLLGRGFSDTDQRGLSGPLYAFGSLAVLGFGFGQTLSFGPNHVWEVLFPFFLVGVIYLSVVWRVRVFLIFGIIFTLIYLISMTAQYFVDTVGWPIALVGLGILMIWIGNLGAQLNRRLFTKKRPGTPEV